jgi:DNA-directed RNA polymerase subunit E'/Rpb7
MKFNWANRIENAILIILTIAVVKFIMIKPLEFQLNRQHQTIEKLAERELYSYQILNNFEKKLKTKDGNLVIDLDNTMSVDDGKITINEGDSIPPVIKDKKTFFDKLKFWKK